MSLTLLQGELDNSSKIGVELFFEFEFDNWHGENSPCFPRVSPSSRAAVRWRAFLKQISLLHHSFIVRMQVWHRYAKINRLSTKLQTNALIHALIVKLLLRIGYSLDEFMF